MQTKLMERQGKLAFENCQTIIAIKSNIGQDLLKLASLLKVNHDNKYYKILGYYTWEEFLAIPEISISRFFAFKLIKICEIWIEKYEIEMKNIQDIDIEKLYLTSTMATQENYEEVLEQARNLSRSDIGQLKSGENYDFDPKRYKIIKCPSCRHQFKVFL